MNLTDPSLAITPTLDGPALMVLAQAGQPLTVAEVARRSARGSEIGIRRAIARLVEQGVVTSITVGRTTAYRLNEAHIAASVVMNMSRLRTELWRRLALEMGSWRVHPQYACVFGSAARHDGDEASDIDILLVRTPTEPEARDHSRRAKSQRAYRDMVEGVSTTTFATWMSRGSLTRWSGYVDHLRELVPLWTGNAAQVVEMNTLEWSRERRAKTEFSNNVTSDAIRIYENLGLSTFRYDKDVPQ